MATGFLDTDELENEKQKLKELLTLFEDLRTRPGNFTQDQINEGKSKDYISQLLQQMETILKLRQEAVDAFEKTGDATEANELGAMFTNLDNVVKKLG